MTSAAHTIHAKFFLSVLSLFSGQSFTLVEILTGSKLNYNTSVLFLQSAIVSSYNCLLCGMALKSQCGTDPPQTNSQQVVRLD